MEGLVKKDILDKAFETLKEEFVGLDDILDKIKTAITPWYLTPEILQRPVVVSLFGMTGTGKTSVVKRLIELLGEKGSSILVDCSEFLSDAGSYTEPLFDQIERVIKEEEGLGCDGSINRKYIFVLDEIQHIRTINESGIEIDRSLSKSIWSLIDSGILTSISNGYLIRSIIGSIDALLLYTKEKGDIKISNLRFEDEQDFVEFINHPYSDRLNNCYEEDNTKQKFNVFSDDTISSIRRYLVTKSSLDTSIKYYNALKNCSTLHELAGVLKKIRDVLSIPKEINCSNSLIFILGNIDEAYNIEDFSNPNYDADTFNDITSSVSIIDVKSALSKRFREEQVARFGNNIILYPTLRSSHFEKIIDNEVSRQIKKLKDLTGIDVIISQDFKWLLYSESVFPAQGVRPIFSTICNILTPLFSDIIELDNGNKGSAIIDTKREKSGIDFSKNNPELYMMSSIDIVISISDKEKTIKLPLQLGDLRENGLGTNIVSKSIHEAGHAIVFMTRTGEVPKKIVSADVTSGGFCYTLSSRHNQISSVYDIDTDVMVSLAGWLAEDLVIKDPKQRLLGSSSDISSAWGTLSNALYKEGYIVPYLFVSKIETQSPGTSSGISDLSDVLVNTDKGSYVTLEQELVVVLERLKREAREILIKESKLLGALANELSKKGSLGEKEIVDLVEKFGVSIKLGLNKTDQIQRNFLDDFIKQNK